MYRTIYATKDFTFDAAHYLTNYEGKCKNLHGHTYRLSITLSKKFDTDLFSISTVLDRKAEDYMVIDFGELSRIVEECILSKYDHADLNSFLPITTAEYMVVDIFNTLSLYFKEVGCEEKLYSVKLWETGTCYVEYKGEENYV